MRFAKKAETKKDPMNVLSPEDANGSSIPSIQSVKKNRKEQVDVFRVYESSLKQLSERQTAKVLGIPRTTLQDWRNRKSGIALSVEMVALTVVATNLCVGPRPNLHRTRRLGLGPAFLVATAVKAGSLIILMI